MVKVNLRKPKEQKLCVVCGKAFTNRAKWQKRGQWESVKYCSERCRKFKNVKSI
jgi:hypothetical protein